MKLKSLRELSLADLQELARLAIDSPYLQDRITFEEIGAVTEVTYSEVQRGFPLGVPRNMLSIPVDCRCFVGRMDLYENGDVFLYDEEGDAQEIDDQLKIAQWLIQKLADESV
jgi:hypothetical protein